MKLVGKVMLILLVVISSMPSMGGPLVPQMEVKAKGGTPIPPSSTTGSSTMVTDFGVPGRLQATTNGNNILNQNVDLIFPQNTEKENKDLYFGRNLPFTLKDTKTGDEFVGFCGQSLVPPGQAMKPTGTTSDPKLNALINLAKKDVTVSNSAEDMAIQVVLWAALNTGWDPNMFSGGYMSTDPKAYGNMVGMQRVVEQIADSWGEIVGAKEVKQNPIIPNVSSKGIEFACADMTGENLQFEIPWQFQGGGRIGDLDKVADISYTVGGGGTVSRGGGKDIVTLPKPSTPSGSLEITMNVTYKGEYKGLNNGTLVTYDSGPGSQPFVLPTKTPTEFKIKVTWECDGQSEDPIPKRNSTELRWFNLPLAFGEFKDGGGFNQLGETTTGTYAGDRGGEEFEAMLGVPTTEKFYANLGGTEGVIDVTYGFEEIEQDFNVWWKTPWEYQTSYSCGEDGKDTCTKTHRGTEFFDHSLTWNFKALNIQEATFRPLGDGKVSQDELGLRIDIKNSAKDKGSYVLEPNEAGLEVGPGTGIDDFNIGATDAWKANHGTFATKKVNGRVATRDDGKQEAFDKANEIIGELFAQNDYLEITLQGETYQFVPAVNLKKESQAFVDDCGDCLLDATDGEEVEYFNPVKEKWSIWSKIPVMGYTGNPTDGAARNVKGTPLLLENIPIPEGSRNGIYEFQSYEKGNYIDYDADVTTIKGGTKEVQGSVAGLADGKATGTATVYEDALDPIDPGNYKDGDLLRLQYTNWQAPTTNGKPVSFKHSGKVPDGAHDFSTADNPRFRSVNPILLHNPTSSMHSWISDIPDSQLEDQRIDAPNERINKHERVSEDKKTARQYVDYDFKLYIPNEGALQDHLGYGMGYNNSLQGIVDLSQMVIGKGYAGIQDSLDRDRQYTNPLSGGWDVSKWTNAKYVKFPYDVKYLGGGNADPEGFYPAGQWIKLTDDNRVAQGGDPEEFDFHVTSDQKDIKDGIVYIVTEANNAPSGLAGNPDALYEDSQLFVNSQREGGGREEGARYSSSAQINIDLIGRIGNTMISDTTDPAWQEVFWDTDGKGKIKTDSPVRKNYGMTFNFFDTVIPGSQKLHSAYDRFGMLKQWHSEPEPLQYLPLMNNFLTKGKTEQTVKMGYTVGGSVQTLGDYDYSMWIYPRNRLAGDFKTGNAGQPFKLITSDPFLPGAKFKEYYDSNVNNTTHGNGGILGKEYQPRFNHVLSHSLADPRAKMNATEKAGDSYKRAKSLGSSKKVLLGNPSWIEVSQPLRTHIGSNNTGGKWGVPNINGNDAFGEKADISAIDCDCSLTNTQKWNWNYSLPQNTKIWFHENKENTSSTGIPKFEAQSKDQYIITSMTFRTKVDRQTYPGEGDEWQDELRSGAYGGTSPLAPTSQEIPDWDLTMFTNAGHENTRTPDTRVDVPKGFTSTTSPGPSKTYDTTQEGDISEPMYDMVWWNYSKPSTTDKDNVGSH